jgi:hypothetical protein
MPSWAIYGNERRRGVHLPPAAVNLLTQPSAFDHADWTKTNSSISANSTTDPDSTSLADTLVEDSALAAHYVEQDVAKDGSAIAYTLSVYAKVPVSNFRERLQLQLHDGAGNGRKCILDVQNGAVLGVAASGFGTGYSGGTPDIRPVGSGWYLCEFAGVTTNSATTVWATFVLDGATGTSADAATYQGDGASGIYLYNAILVQD